MTSVTPPALPLTWSQRHPFMAMWIDFAMAALLLMATVFFGTLGLGLIQALLGAQSGNGNIVALEVMLVVSSSFGMVLAALITCALRHPPSLAERTHARAALKKASTWYMAVATGVGLFVASSALLLMLSYFGQTVEPSNLALLEVLKARHPLLLWLILVVLAPFSEELLFRRVLFGRLWAAGRPLAGMWISSLLFALMHEIPGSTASPWPQALLLFAFYTLMGMAFAQVYRRSGTLWAAIIAHAVNNALAALLL